MTSRDERVRATWAALHAMPELGFTEQKTSAFIADRLRTAGFDVRTGVGKTGVVGTLKGKNPGPVLALRADMDALGHKLDGQVVARHTCGHDANSAMMLTAAEEIAAQGLERGTLKVVFQPAEELLGGALACIAEGVVDDVDMMLGMHFRPPTEAKLGQAMPALYHSASYVIDAEITGLSAHGARPHLGCNAIDAAAAVVMAVNAIHLDPGVSSSVKVTTLMAGGVSSNVIPDKATLVLDLRSEFNADMDTLIAKTLRAIETGASTVGATGVGTVRGGCPAAAYDDAMVAVINEAIGDVLGEAGKAPSVQTAGGEDFHFFAKHKPSLKTAYVGLGANVTPSLHHPDMTFDQAALVNGVDIFVASVRRLLA